MPLDQIDPFERSYDRSMVRLVRVRDRNGKLTWVEDGPTVCPNNHSDQLIPGWGACPECTQMLRIWKCQVDACDAVLLDDEHQH